MRTHICKQPSIQDFHCLLSLLIFYSSTNKVAVRIELSVTEYTRLYPSVFDDKCNGSSLNESIVSLIRTPNAMVICTPAPSGPRKSGAFNFFQSPPKIY